MTLDHAEAVAALGARDAALRKMAEAQRKNEQLVARIETLIQSTPYVIGKDCYMVKVSDLRAVLAFSDGKQEDDLARVHVQHAVAHSPTAARNEVE